jgi:N-acetylglucosamine kinase-like BadF-type ATPase
MSERQKTLAEIQKECRRFAAEIGNPEASRILSRAADDLERHVRQSQTESTATKH